MKSTEDVAENKAAVKYKFTKMAPSKLAIMSIATFGYYELYWLYKNWKAVKAAEKSDIWPIPRAIFTIIFTWSLFQKMKIKAAGWLFAAFVILNLAARLDDFYWLVSFLSFAPLLYVQFTINKTQKAGKIEGFSTAERIIAVLGSLVFTVFITAVLTGNF